MKISLILPFCSAVTIEKLREKEVCYDFLGCFSNEGPFSCFHSRLELKFHSLSNCFKILKFRELPGDPKDMTFQYKLYRDSKNYDIVKYDKTEDISWENVDSILLITHGWHDSAGAWWIREIRIKILSLNLTPSLLSFLKALYGIDILKFSLSFRK